MRQEKQRRNTGAKFRNRRDSRLQYQDLDKISAVDKLIYQDLYEKGLIS